jgi:hypothetical protein
MVKRTQIQHVGKPRLDVARRVRSRQRRQVEGAMSEAVARHISGDTRAMPDLVTVEQQEIGTDAQGSMSFPRLQSADLPTISECSWKRFTTIGSCG